ncbi:hypothetical protein ACFU51_37950, partial [Streptomyces sp. NPDC057430]
RLAEKTTLAEAIASAPPGAEGAMREWGSWVTSNVSPEVWNAVDPQTRAGIRETLLTEKLATLAVNDFVLAENQITWVEDVATPVTSEVLPPPVTSEVLPPAASEAVPPAVSEVLPPAASEVLPPAAPEVLPPAAPEVLPPVVPEVVPPVTSEVLPPVVSEVVPPAASEVVPPAVPERVGAVSEQSGIASAEGRRMGEAGAPDEVRMMTAIVKSVESLGELAPRGESRLAEVLRDLTPGQLEKFGALMRQNGLEEFGLGARELTEPGGLVDQALAGKDFLVNDFLTMETLVAEVMRTTHPDTTEVPAVPDKPLPERPLPDKPLPEKPLPEKPLPERPLPRVPVQEAGGPQSGSTGRVGDLPLGGESASPARQDSGFGEVPLGDAKSPETVARSAPEGVGDVSSGTVGEGSVRSGLPEVTVVAEGSLAEGMTAEIGSVSDGGQGLGGRAGGGEDRGGEGDWLDQALGDLRPVPEGEPLSATPDSPGNPALEAFRASAEAFRASMEAFPELPDSVRDLQLVEVLEGLSPAQKIKLGVLLEEHGLADGAAMVESGALRDLLWPTLDTLRNPGEFPPGAGAGAGDEALAARVEALRDGERPVDVEGEYGPLPEGELEALLDQAPGVPDGVPSEAG